MKSGQGQPHRTLTDELFFNTDFRSISRNCEHLVHQRSDAIGHASIERSSASIIRSRILNFCGLPVAVKGISSTKRT